MERKFKVGDEVKSKSAGVQGKVVFVDDDSETHLPYLMVYANVSGSYNSLWRSERDLTLIKPERKYQKGDKVWNKNTNSVWEFLAYTKYNDELECIISYNSAICTSPISNIEPYTGQDKQTEQPKPTHPYTVILKSGVKVGLSDERAKAIIKHRHLLQEEDLYDSQLAVLQIDEKFDFTNMEISAIVPTENIK